MTETLHQKLNAMLADRRGKIPYGDEVGKGIFQFRRANEIKLPHRTGTKVIIMPNGLAVPVPVYEMMTQLRPDDNRWIIAKWLNPSEDEWKMKYENGAVEWPKHGYYFCFQPLEAGKEPTEEWTSWLFDHLDYQESLTPQQHREKVREQGEKPYEEYKKKVQDIAAEHFVNHVPGKSGGDYLAFSEPSQKKQGATT